MYDMDEVMMQQLCRILHTSIAKQVNKGFCVLELKSIVQEG